MILMIKIKLKKRASRSNEAYYVEWTPTLRCVRGGGSIEPVSYKDASNPSHDEREGLLHFESQLNKTWIQQKNGLTSSLQELDD